MSLKNAHKTTGNASLPCEEAEEGACPSESSDLHFVCAQVRECAQTLVLSDLVILRKECDNPAHDGLKNTGVQMLGQGYN